MANPSDKSKPITDFLETLYGRTTAITHDRCIPPPIGCGEPVTDFRDPISVKEYTISGLCQTCQDKVFGNEPDDDADRTAPA